MFTHLRHYLFAITIGALVFCGCTQLSNIANKIPSSTYAINAGKTAAYLLHTTGLADSEEVKLRVETIADVILLNLPETITVDTLTNEINRIIVSNITLTTNDTHYVLLNALTETVCTMIDTCIKKIVEKYPEEFAGGTKLYETVFVFMKSFITQFRDLNGEVIDLNVATKFIPETAIKGRATITYADVEKIANITGESLDEDVFNEISELILPILIQ